jgi:hypothetical protein
MSFTLQFGSQVLGAVAVPAPDGSFPGGPLLLKLLGYGRYIVLALGIGAVFYGGGAWGWSKAGNASAAGAGRTWVMGGIAAALLAGVGPALIDQLFTAAS